MGRCLCGWRLITRRRKVLLGTVLWVVVLCVAPACPASTESGNPASPATVATEQAEALKKEELAVAQALARDFPDRVEPIVLMGNIQHRLGRTTEAMALWQTALKRDPKRPEVYEKMGWFAMEKGQYEQALVHWRKVLEITPKASGIHSGMARALMGLNQHHEAIAHLQKEIEISPQSSFDLFLLGQEYLQVEQYEKAKAGYEKAIGVDPNLTNAHYGLFTVCARLGQRAEATEHMATFKRLKARDMETLKDRNEAFDDLIDMRKDAAETMMLAGQAYQASGKLARAEQLQYRAAALDPDNAMYHLHGGALSMQLRHFAQAEKAFGQVITLAPKSSRGYSGLAHLYLQVNHKLPQARQLAEKAVALEPTAFNHYVLSWARDRNGDRAGARAAIKRAIELEPNNPRFRQIAQRMEKKN
jgi:tetratricopeptide (TPR) repeat protein